MSEPTVSPGFDRRNFLRVGGATVALSALVAACSGSDEGAGPEGIAAAGTRPPLATATSATVNNVVLLRTATSLHYNALGVVAAVSAVAGVDPAILDAAAAYKELLQSQADALAAATTAAEGEPYEKSNPVLETRVVQPALALLKVSTTQATDAANLLHAVAALAAASHQSFLAQFTSKELRQTAMAIGVVHAQVASTLAGIISPENIVTADAIESAEPTGSATTETTVASGLPTTSVSAPATTVAASIADVAVYMVPAAFGALSAVQVVLGKAGVDDSSKRQQLNIETPSLNSMMY